LTVSASSFFYCQLIPASSLIYSDFYFIRSYSSSSAKKISFVPIKIYSNAEADKNKIIKDKKNKNSKMKNKKTNKIQFSDGSQKLVGFGSNLTSTVGIKFSITQLAMVRFAPYQKSVIIGLVLSDGWLRFASKTNKNALLGFKQSLDKFAYVWFVFNILSHYCSSSPRLTTSIRAGNRYYGLEFFTRSMPCITELHSLFYFNVA